MKSFGSNGSFLWALLLVLFAFICTGNSFKQELWFYDAQGNDIHFESQVSDMSDHYSFLQQVTKICTKGMWYMFSDVNFQTYHDRRTSPTERDIVCLDYKFAAPVKSLRHVGAIDTDTDALSLYEGMDFNGPEIFVTERVLTGITNQIKTIVGTGYSDWMLFEGQNLDGKSACFQVPFAIFYYSSSAVISLNLATIGSVFKGCDLQEIQNYKMLHKSRFVNSN